MMIDRLAQVMHEFRERANEDNQKHDWLRETIKWAENLILPTVRGNRTLVNRIYDANTSKRLVPALLKRFWQIQELRKTHWNTLKLWLLRGNSILSWKMADRQPKSKEALRLLPRQASSGCGQIHLGWINWQIGMTQLPELNGSRTKDFQEIMKCMGRL